MKPGSRFLFLLPLLCAHFFCYAQDPDFNDYRRKTENFSRIANKDIRSDLAAFTIGGIEESLNKQPLKQIPVTSFGDNYITYDSNKLSITIKAGVFVPTKHKLAFEEKRLLKIDGKPYYGNYTKVPQTTIASVTVIDDKDTIVIPPNAFSDLYNPGFVYRDASGVMRSQDAVYLSPDKHRIYIYMLNRDDTGGYEVTWVIQDKKYLRRVLDYGFK